MSGEFFDSNVIVYTDDHDDPVKQAQALELVERGLTARRMVVSTQVLQEYFVVVTRKLGVAVEHARRKVELLASANLISPGAADVLGAIDLHRLHGFSFWDALIIRTALVAGCETLYTEDLQDGRRIDGLTVRNPFL